MNLAPVLLFVYNRPEHTQKAIDALKRNDLASESELFIYSDAAKTEQDRDKVQEVRDYIQSVVGFKKITIIEREKNWGLADSIIDGVTTIINQYGKIIVLEDDLVTSPYFLSFMNGALDFYQAEQDIYSITGFSFSTEFIRFPKDFVDDVYLNIRPMSWSWATWKSEWQGIDWEVKDFDRFILSKDSTNKFNQGGTDLTNMLKEQIEGRLDSWYIRWCYNAFKKRKLTIYPTVSFVNNIGHDNTGVHCGVDHDQIYSHSELNLNNSINFNKNISVNTSIVSNFNKAFDVPVLARIKGKIKNILNYVKNI